MKVNPYVNFAGRCEEAFRYYEQHLGAKVGALMRWKDMPDAAQHTPPGMGDKILHGNIAVGDTVIMASDVPNAEPMRSAYLTLSVDTIEEAERVYAALIDGGQEFMKMNETFFAHRFGQLRDRFGINWMVINNKPMG